MKQKMGCDMTSMKQEMGSISIKQEKLKTQLRDKIKDIKEGVGVNLNEVRYDIPNMETRFKRSLKDIRKNVKIVR